MAGLPANSRHNLVVVDDSDDILPQEKLVAGAENSRCWSVLCNPRGTVHRFVVFAFMCFLSFGNYFCYDSPSSLQTVIEKDMDISNKQYGILYSVYSWPNVFLSFLGGFMIDRCLGVRWGAILFAFFIAVGQFVVASGAFLNMFTLMVVGRFIFAIGGESLAVAQNTYTVKWFKGRELNTVFGIQLSFARIGSTINQATMYLIYKWISTNYYSGPKALGSSLYIAFITTLISLTCGFVLWYFDRRRDGALALAAATDSQPTLEAEGTAAMADPNVGSDDAQLISDEKDDEKAPFSPRDILKFPPTMWIVCFICVTFYAAVFPLVSFGQLFYVNKFHLHPYTASICNGLIYFIAIPASIIGGLLVDHFGRNVVFIIISVSIALVGHCLLAFTFLSPFVATVILGCAYSLLAASLWPCVAFIVPGKAVATAYGVMQSIQNLGLAILFILIGILVDNYGYLVLELLFILVLSLALGLSFLLYFVDKSYGGLLIMDGKTRKDKIKSQ